MIEMAEGGALQAIKEIGDRLDGKCAQTIERGDVPLEMLSDSELYAIIARRARSASLDQLHWLLKSHLRRSFVCCHVCYWAPLRHAECP